MQYHDLWRNYSLRMFLTHKDAVILLKQMGAKPGASHALPSIPEITRVAQLMG